MSENDNTQEKWGEALESMPWPVWDFEAKKGFVPPENDEWLEALVCLRSAFALMTFPKEKLVNAYREDPEMFTSIMEDMARHKTNAESVLTVINAALARLLMVGASIAEQEGRFTN